MEYIKNSANFELSFIYFCEQYAWFTDADTQLLLLSCSSAQQSKFMEPRCLY